MLKYKKCHFERLRLWDTVVTIGEYSQLIINEIFKV